MPMAQDFRNWKRYRGGWAPDLMLFDLKTFATKNITSNPANDAQPMWHGNTIYFMSDRGANERNNIWAYDVVSGGTRQVTDFGDFDITFPSLGPDGIVFQAGGRLYMLDLASEKASEVPVRVVTDEATPMCEYCTTFFTPPMKIPFVPAFHACTYSSVLLSPAM